ncbi:MAG: ATP-binding protein [Patescibacteria group bacterium]
MTLTLCPDAQPNFLNLFDVAIAPAFLFYAYIPILILSIIFGIVVWQKRKEVVYAKYFTYISFAFAAWIFLILFQWIAADVEVVYLAWQLLVIPEILIYIFSIYFCYSFLFIKEVPTWCNYIFLIIYTGILLLVPTTLNISYFNLSNCEGVVGRLWDIIYILELVILLIIPVIVIEKFIKSSTRKEKFLSILLPIGVLLFLGFFWASNYFAELSKTYEINLWGPLGMVVFLLILMYLIVQFRAFNIKLIATQAFLVILIILIGSQLFFVTTDINRILIGITLILTVISGLLLVKSVKREIEQREKIEKLAGELKIANEGQANLIHIINHQIKGYMTKARLVFDALLTDKDYGPVSESAQHLVKEGYDSVTEGVNFVTDFLNASNIEKGTYKYEMQSLDMRELVQGVAEKQRETAEDKGLSFKLQIEEGNYNTRGDKTQLEQAIRNLIDNSIRYTPKGEVKIQMSRLRQGFDGQAKDGDKILFKIEDTGVGISSELKSKLFTKGGRDKDSLKVNINSTGFGLSFVKEVAEAHKGRVWVESAGTGRGSTFFMELPVNS